MLALKALTGERSPFRDWPKVRTSEEHSFISGQGLTSGQALGPTQLHGYEGTPFFPVIKRPEREADRSPIWCQLRMNVAVPPPTLSLMACIGATY